MFKTKIMRFSQFMAGSNSGYFVVAGQESQCTYLLHSQDVAVSRRIFIGMDDEHKKALKALKWIGELRVAEEPRPRGGVVDILDIGANLGHICIPLLVNHILNNAIAYEPEPKNFKLLKCNGIINGLESRIEFNNAAIGELPDDTLKLELSADNFGDHRIKISNENGLYNEKCRHVVEVPSTNLNTVLANYPDFSKLLIWIDVQGYEGSVLTGGDRVLPNRPAIGLEFWPYGLHRTQNFNKLMKALEPYQTYFDLSMERPVALPLTALEAFYIENVDKDYRMMDILML